MDFHEKKLSSSLLNLAKLIPPEENWAEEIDENVKGATVYDWGRREV